MDKKDINTDFSVLNEWIYNLLTNLGIPENGIKYAKLILMLAIAIVIVYALQLIVRSILTFVFKKVTQTTSISIFKFAIKNRLPHYLALAIPYTFVRAAIPVVFEDFNNLINPCIKITDLYMVFMVIWIITAFFRSGADILQSKEAFKDKPFKSYLQVIQIILYIFGAVAIFSILTGKSATVFFTAMGAASAVFMLVFKDTIMGFVSSIQLSSNEMLRLGDWITMAKYGADGTVEEINLTTVKVINFDKTITTIPTYAMISDSFQNWRGMQEAGGRRFTRSIYIIQADVRFLSDTEIEEWKKNDILKSYIESKEQEFSVQNKKNGVKDNQTVGSYRLTNNDLFIEYATWYLKNHPKISKSMTIMVRQLAPTIDGLPIQLYTFTNVTVWLEYEEIISEIINHLLSTINSFGLRVHESMAGTDDLEILVKQNKLTQH